MINDQVARVKCVAESPKSLRGNLVLSHFVVLDSEKFRGKYSTLATFHQIKAEEIGFVISRFKIGRAHV